MYVHFGTVEFVCILPDGGGRCIATSCSAMKFCHIREWEGNETPEQNCATFPFIFRCASF